MLRKGAAQQHQDPATLKAEHRVRSQSCNPVPGAFNTPWGHLCSPLLRNYLPLGLTHPVYLPACLGGGYFAVRWSVPHKNQFASLLSLKQQGHLWKGSGPSLVSRQFSMQTGEVSLITRRAILRARQQLTKEITHWPPNTYNLIKQGSFLKGIIRFLEPYES